MDVAQRYPRLCGFLHFLMCANPLSTKIVTIMAKALMQHCSNAFLTLSLAVDGGGASISSMISQRFLVVSTISNLNFKKLKF